MSLSNSNNLVNPANSDGKNEPSSLNKGRGEFNYREYYAWMNGQLSVRTTSLAVALLGNPTYKRSNEWRWGKKGEVVVYVAGEKLGRFSDFEAGVSGDALELVKYKTGYRGKDLSDWVKNFIGYQPKLFVRREKETWTPIIPVPEEALVGDLTKGLSESFKRKGMHETGQYCYRNMDGNVLGYVVRYENGDDKMTLPLTYCSNEKGAKGWWWKGFPVPRLPYGAELLKDSTKTILIVEGEKKCDAARTIFPDMTIVSWIAGTGSVSLTEWSVLKGREVILWPDNDAPGLKCMGKLKGILDKVGAQSVRVVQLPANTPQQWDLADPLPDGWNRETLDYLISNSV